MIDCVAAPFDHKLPVAEEELRVIEPPGQKPDGPVITGFGGAGLMVIGISFETLLAAPQVGVEVQTRKNDPAAGKSAPLMVYVVPVWPKKSEMIPPVVVRKPHCCLGNVPPPVSVTVAVPPVALGQTAVLPTAAMFTADRGGQEISGNETSKKPAAPLPVNVTPPFCPTRI